MISDSYGHGYISMLRAGDVLHLQAACQTHNSTAVSAEILCHHNII